MRELHGLTPSPRSRCPRVLARRRCSAWKGACPCLGSELRHRRRWKDQAGRHVLTAEPYSVAADALPLALLELDLLGLDVTTSSRTAWPGAQLLIVMRPRSKGDHPARNFTKRVRPGETTRSPTSLPGEYGGSRKVGGRPRGRPVTAPCSGCGGPVAYGGRGRPRVRCEACRGLASRPPQEAPGGSVAAAVEAALAALPESSRRSWRAEAARSLAAGLEDAPQAAMIRELRAVMAELEALRPVEGGVVVELAARREARRAARALAAAAADVPDPDDPPEAS